MDDLGPWDWVVVEEGGYGDAPYGCGARALYTGFDVCASAKVARQRC